MDVELIRYRFGMLEKPSQRKRLRARYLERENVPIELTQLIEEKGIMNIEGTLGTKRAGDPIEYEQVTIKADGKQTTFEIYNKGISMFVNETDELKRVFEFCVKLRNELRL